MMNCPRFRRPSRRRSAGYFMLELMVVIALLGVFAMLLSQYMNIERAALRATTDGQQTATQFDSMLSRLRADVWSAAAIEAGDGGALSLTQPDGQVIHWQPTADGATRRTAADEAADDGPNQVPPNWSFNEVAVQFMPAARAVELHLTAGPRQGKSTIILVSQFLLVTEPSPIVDPVGGDT